MLPAGKPLKTGLDVAATDFNTLLLELRTREFNGYVSIAVKGTGGIEEGTLLMEKGKVIGCSYEYLRHGKTFAGQKAFERVLNATAAKEGVIDVFELEIQQIDLTLAFNENLVYVPNTSDLRHVKVDDFSPLFEQEVVSGGKEEKNLAKKYRLTGIVSKSEDKPQGLS